MRSYTELSKRCWKESYRTKIETDGISVTRKSDRAAIVIPFEDVALYCMDKKNWNRAARTEALRQAKACNSECWG